MVLGIGEIEEGLELAHGGVCALLAQGEQFLHVVVGTVSQGGGDRALGQRSQMVTALVHSLEDTRDLVDTADRTAG
jgi:hypothetical protein